MKTINKTKLEQLLQKGALLVDIRSPVDFRNAHINGSVNLPLRNFINKIMSMPKNSAIVIYSNASNDSDLTQGINYAENLGFTNLFIGEFKHLKE